MNRKAKEIDEQFMRRALELAQGAHPTPNPKVGAVVVKQGNIIGEGRHIRPGTKHAEIKALQKAGKAADGATLYVTLEPCAHTGKTPPCIDAVIASGVSRVVIGMQDPNPLVHGKSIRRLKKTGVKVTVGVLAYEVQRLNEAFVHYMQKKTPFITIKTAMSADGKIATRTGDSRGLSGKYEQLFVHQYRADSDAICVGISTILTDNPRLTCRIPGGRDPLRIILDSSLRIPVRAAVLSDSNAIVVTTNAASKSKEQALQKRGIEVLRCGSKKVDIRKLIHILGKRGTTSLLVEGGGTINAAFLSAGVVQKMIIAIAPKIIGGVSAPTLVDGEGVSLISQAHVLKGMSAQHIGSDIVLTGYLV